MKYSLSVVMLSFLLLFGCSSSSDKVLVIDVSDKQKGYPAMFVSLDNNSAVLAQEIRNKANDLNYKIEADLWVEPKDPEIMGLGKRFNGILHMGGVAKVSFTQAKYNKILSIPESIKWHRSISRYRIKVGTVFLVKSSKGIIYKAKIDRLSKTLMQITYSKI